MGEIGLSRRTALAGLGGAGLALSLGLPTQARAAAAGSDAAAPTVAYFNDGLLADPSGRLPAHRRPRGYRGARGVARLSAAQRIAAGLPV